MDEKAVNALYESIWEVLEGQDYDCAMVVLGAIHNTLALEHTLDEDRLRALYGMMADTAVCMAFNESNAELQTEEDSPQETQRKAKRSKTGHVPGSSRPH